MASVIKTVKNPLFARYFNRFAARREERGNRELRQELLRGLPGLAVYLQLPHHLHVRARRSPARRV